MATRTRHEWVRLDLNNGPTVADALPDFSNWITAVRPLALRTPRTYESYPSAYRFVFSPRGFTRSNEYAVAGVPLSIAQLAGWNCEMLDNRRPVLTPARDISTAFVRVDNQTDRLTKSYSLKWLRGQRIIQPALDELNRWRQDTTLDGAFRTSVGKFMAALSAFPLNYAPNQDIVCPLNVGAGSLPWPKSGGWGVLYDRIDWEITIHWAGGKPNAQDRAVLNAWLAVQHATPSFQRAVTQIRDSTGGTVFSNLCGHAFYRSAITQLPRPLLWQRHPTLPTIQALPLTQSQSPPSHPSSSRQLSPFELLFDHEPFVTSAATPFPLPKQWIFGVRSQENQLFATDEFSAAEQWPVYLGNGAQRQIAREWCGQVPSASFDGPRLLPMAFLSLPGVTNHAARTDMVAPIPDANWLPMQINYGLPYLTEVYALAELPREAGISQPLAASQLVSDQPLRSNQSSCNETAFLMPARISGTQSAFSRRCRRSHFVNF